VADRIIEDVIALGWPVGQVLGAEAELLERYVVSRAVFREAVRLVEHREVARTRRGPGGGLVITEPTIEAVIDAVVLYLYRVEARLDEVFEARIVLEEIACDLASRRLEEADLISLRAFVDEGSPVHARDHRALHNLLAHSTHNPAIELFVDVLNRVVGLYSAGWNVDDAKGQSGHAHARIAEAVIGGDSATARRRMRTHLQAESEYIRNRRTTRQALPGAIITGHEGRGKLAEDVVRRIVRDILTRDLRPGQLIGSETELIEREGVSRAVFREAVRILEHHQIANMRRGPGGGLFVSEPSVGAVTDVTAILLARRGMRLEQVSELRTDLETAIVDLAVKRIDDSGRARIADALEREEHALDREARNVVHDLHAAIAGAASNRVLELVALVLIRLSRLYQVERLAPRDLNRIRAEIRRTHSAIVEAIIGGDQDLARHRMHRHMTALGAVVR
jgi:DNA-binding FadR family transcriptional regulator